MDDPNVTNQPDLSVDPGNPDPGVTDPQVTDPALGDGIDPANQDPALVNDDSEEIEHEGQKYRIPKALKPALMMQADYTRKTQEVADQRRTLETHQQQLAQQAQMHQQHLQEVARVVAIDEQLAQFAQVDWNALSNQDPVSAQQLFMQYQQLKDGRAQVLGQLQQKEQQRQLEMQQATAKRIEEANAVLARDIKGWSPELAGKLRDFGTTIGFSAQEMAMAAADPRVFKLLHRAYLGDQLVAKQKAAAAPAVPAARPVAQVGSNAPAGKDPSRMSTDEWMRHRNEQLRKRSR